MKRIKMLVILCSSCIFLNATASAKANSATKSVDEAVMKLAKQYEKQGDYESAMELYFEAADEGSSEALDALGKLYAQGKGSPKDYNKAIEYFESAANQGSVSAQKNLGVMYLKGYGVKQSYFQSMQWFKKAAEKGDAESQYNYGVGFFNGMGLRQDKKLAKQWFGKACDQGHQGGCSAYKLLNEQGF